jgi:4-hydroxy-tetrahydrodipicolinate reductase
LTQTRIIINGAKGRMGQTLIACAGRNPELRIVGQFDLGDDLQSRVEETDAVIDFSVHEATAGIASVCAAHGKSLVIGTTGHSEAETSQIARCQSVIPIVWSANYSTGVNALFWLARKAAEILGPGFDIEVVEMHHRAKRDAPSGTAATLGRILAEVRKLPGDQSLRHGRRGITGEREAAEIGMHSLRGGDVVGDHTVIFAANGERLELTHKASSRETFAHGALRAAQWAVQQKPGRYDMLDVLALK